jgi:peroxisomal 3,2-trans-enoyl-CoA isomerase
MKLYNGFEITQSSDGVRTIKLNRPKKKNAITLDMYTSLTSALNDAAQDESAVFVVLTGSGDYFSSGNDLTNFTNTGGKEMDEVIDTGGLYLVRTHFTH